ncbi:MAG TPA: hypothetical protein VF181_07665 [Balneolaceae bacterium]
MSNPLITISANQLEFLLQQAIGKYHGEEYVCTVKDLSSPNVSSLEDKITFKVEIRGKEHK